jgi:hypothetical protein
MRLFQHADFEQAILRATEHFRDRRLRPAIIEKDYYVTEALRLIAATAYDKVFDARNLRKSFQAACVKIGLGVETGPQVWPV